MRKIKTQKVSLNVIFYREGDKFIAFSPALNLSTCADTMEQAKKRFEEIFCIFIEEIEGLGTLEEVLLDCGWKKVGNAKKQWEPPLFVGQAQETVNIPCPA